MSEFRQGWSKCPRCQKTIERITIYENGVLLGFQGGHCEFCGWQGTKHIDPPEFKDNEKKARERKFRSRAKYER